MRRVQPNTLPRFLRNGEAPSKMVQPGIWRASFELRSITPILGGGVRSFEPDLVDIVRVPSIRGQLRWWWRGLFQAWGEQPERTLVDALFTREARLWGGVGVPGQGREGDKERPGLRSRVRLTAEVLDRGKEEPAGFHEWNDRHLKSVPRWNIGWKLGYALFPLQRPQPERELYEKNVTTRAEMPTRLVRTGLRFRLHLTVLGAEPGTGPARAEVVQVLASIWAWLHFSGLGARTRRGFGALELKELGRIDPLSDLDPDLWRRLFQGPGEAGVLAWLRDFERAASPCGRLWPCEVLVGQSTRQANRAQEDMVGYLKYFRQEPDFARDPGRPPGQSRWPEPHLLRVLAPPGEPFKHRPPAEAAAQVAAGEVGAPRAAFGLPIQVQFKDEGDKRANATLVPPGAQRWPSPLLLRPLRCANGDYLPVAVLLPVPPPTEVELQYARDPKETKRCSVARSAGARFDIAKALRATGGNALKAFADWLIQQKGFRRISLVKGGVRA